MKYIWAFVLIACVLVFWRAYHYARVFGPHHTATPRQKRFGNVCVVAAIVAVPVAVYAAYMVLRYNP